MAAATLSLSIGSLPVMAAAAPAAQAAPSAAIGPCTVTAGTPYHLGGDTVSGKKIIKYPISVNCTRSGVRVTMQQRMMEDDGDHWWNRNDVQKGWHTPAGTPLSFSTAGVKKVDPIPTYRLTRTLDDLGAAEEVYHQVKFWVSSNGVTAGPIVVTSPNRSIRP